MDPLNPDLSIFSFYPFVLSEDLLRYIIGAGGIYLLINVGLATRLASRKIRPRKPAVRQIWIEIVASLRTVLIFSVVGLATLAGARLGVLRLYFDMAEYGVTYLVLSSLAVIVLHDAYFYWAHRFLHLRRVFKAAHRLHHKSHNPTPFTAYSFDVGEAVANALFLPLVLVFMPMHPLTILIFSSHMILRNTLGHSGYEVFPARRGGRPMFDWMTTVTHHDIHHARAGWNFGLYFTWWDRWMGTEYPKYHAQFADVVSARDARSGGTGQARVV